MKFFISSPFIFLAIASAEMSLTHASLEETIRPAELVCESTHANRIAAKFMIVDFDTKNPSTNLDTSTVSFENVLGTVKYCASNECENYYCWVFFAEDLDKLAKNKVLDIQGLMNYFNFESSTSNRGVESHTVSVTCRKH